MVHYRVTETCYPYFITMTVVKWLPIFVSPAICDIVIESLEYCRQEKGLRIHSYTIMPTHVHLILSAESGLSSVLRDLKTHTSKRIVSAFSGVRNPPFENVFKFCGRNNRPPTEHKVWQDGGHPEIIMTEAFFQQKLNYIHQNPYRKGLVTDPLAWTYSSIRDYNGAGTGPLEIDWIDW